MPSLLKLIEQNKSKFKAMPEGPVGLMLTFDPRYKHLSDAVERAFNGRAGLSSFVVTCYEDECTLRALMARVPQFPSFTFIYVRKPEPRFTPDRVATRHPVLLDVISTKSDMIFNLLVDEFRASNTFLFDVSRKT